jgi:hypothetical protein
MTTYPKSLLIDAICSDKPLGAFQISYFGERYRNQLHAEVLNLFQRVSKERGLTKADIARRLNKRPEQVTRWLSAPGNWTLDTVSELMLALGYEPVVGSRSLAETVHSNDFHPLSIKPSQATSTPNASITVSELRIRQAPTALKSNTSTWESAA